jgi:hypothetical protein
VKSFVEYFSREEFGDRAIGETIEMAIIPREKIVFKLSPNIPLKAILSLHIYRLVRKDSKDVTMAVRDEHAVQVKLRARQSDQQIHCGSGCVLLCDEPTEIYEIESYCPEVLYLIVNVDYRKEAVDANLTRTDDLHYSVSEIQLTAKKLERYFEVNYRARQTVEVMRNFVAEQKSWLEWCAIGETVLVLVLAGLQYRSIKNLLNPRSIL